MLQVTTETRSLLAVWTYLNPREGAVIDGYHVYINGLLNRDTTSARQNISIEGLTPFTNYTVEVSAFNTLGDGTVQEGPRSDPVTEMTLADGGYYNIIIVTGGHTVVMPLCKKAEIIVANENVKNMKNDVFVNTKMVQII